MQHLRSLVGSNSLHMPEGEKRCGWGTARMQEPSCLRKVRGVVQCRQDSDPNANRWSNDHVSSVGEKSIRKFMMTNCRKGKTPVKGKSSAESEKGMSGLSPGERRVDPLVRNKGWCSSIVRQALERSAERRSRMTWIRRQRKLVEHEGGYSVQNLVRHGTTCLDVDCFRRSGYCGFER